MKYSMLLLLILLASCDMASNTDKPYIDYTILNDRTDYHKLRPDPNAFIASLHIPNYKAREYTIRYLEISDKKTVPVVVLHLPSTAAIRMNANSGTPLYRERLILQFYDTVRKTLTPTGGNDTSSLGHSEIFTTLASQLTALSARTATIKKVFVFSDLQERSPIYDTYSKVGQQLLAYKPDSVAHLLTNLQLLPASLRGITVHFLYEPQTREQDWRFNQMLSVYRKVLEPLGATIIQQAQNKSFENL